MNNEPMVKMIISIHQNGQLVVENIPPNKIMAYGMLEVAKQSINEYFDKLQNNLIQPAAVLPKIS